MTKKYRGRPQITNEMGRWQLVPFTFAQAEVAANQAAAALLPIEVHGAVVLDNLGYTMPFAGYVVGISLNLSAAASAGELTVAPTRDATVTANPEVTVSTAMVGADMCKRTRNYFEANAVIGAKVTTDGSWDGTASDLLVQVWVLLHITGTAQGLIGRPQ